MSDDGKGGERLERALALLAEEVRARLARHPQGHLLAGGREVLDLALALPAGGGAGGGRLTAEAARLVALTLQVVDPSICARPRGRAGGGRRRMAACAVHRSPAPPPAPPPPPA